MCCPSSRVWVSALSSLLHTRKLRPREAEGLALTRQVDRCQILSPEEGGLDCGGTLIPCHSAPSSRGHSWAAPSLACDMCVCQQPTRLPEWSGHFDLGAAGCNPAQHSLPPRPNRCHPHPNHQPPGLKSLPRLWASGSQAGQETWRGAKIGGFLPLSGPGPLIPGLLAPALTPRSQVSLQGPEGAWEHQSQIGSLLRLESSKAFPRPRRGRASPPPLQLPTPSTPSEH